MRPQILHSQLHKLHGYSGEWIRGGLGSIMTFTGEQWATSTSFEGEPYLNGMRKGPGQVTRPQLVTPWRAITDAVEILWISCNTSF